MTNNGTGGRDERGTTPSVSADARPTVKDAGAAPAGWRSIESAPEGDVLRGGTPRG